MHRLIPDPGPTDIDTELAKYRPFDTPPADRPRVAVNMVTSLDGRASLNGRSSGLGTPADLQMLLKLRTRFDAVMIGAGTMRAERYGRIIADAGNRAQREGIGLDPDPLAVIISGRLDIPFDAPLFTTGNGRILVFTNDPTPPPETETPLHVEQIDGPIKITEVLHYLREKCEVRALLCEGGPHLMGQITAAGTLDDLFLTIAPTLTGEEDAPRILEGALAEPVDLDLVGLAEDGGDLFARYRRRGVA